MNQVTVENHALEVFGPRGQSWRPVHQECLKAAAELARAGRLGEAIIAAEDAWIEAHGQMHGVAFRVRTQVERFTGNAQPDVLAGYRSLA